MISAVSRMRKVAAQFKIGLQFCKSSSTTITVINVLLGPLGVQWGRGRGGEEFSAVLLSCARKEMEVFCVTKKMLALTNALGLFPPFRRTSCCVVEATVPLKSLILVPVATSTRKCTLTSSQGSIGHLR